MTDYNHTDKARRLCELVSCHTLGGGGGGGGGERERERERENKAKSRQRGATNDINSIFKKTCY